MCNVNEDKELILIYLEGFMDAGAKVFSAAPVCERIIPVVYCSC